MHVATHVTLAALPGLVALGVAAGYLAGMFGVGGSFLITPLLVVVFRVPLPVAVGTGLCQVVGTALASYLRHRKLGQAESRFDVLMIPGCVLGVEAGARALTALGAAGWVSVAGRSLPVANLAVEGIYAVGLGTLAAVHLAFGRLPADVLGAVRPAPLARLGPGPRVDLPKVPLTGVSAPLVAYLGLAMGFVSGLLGLGGGIALMPVLIFGFGFAFRQASGTGVLCLVVTSSVGTVAHGLRGNVDLVLAMTLLSGSTLAAQFGARAARDLSARSLSRIFALVLGLAVAALVWDLLRRSG